jgi:phage portal protein BeeE
MDMGSNGNGVTAYNVSAWAMRAVALRSQAVAGAPLMLRRSDEEVIETHPVLDLLYQVDSEWDYGQLMQHTEASLLTYGAAYWYKARPAPGGRVTQLVFLSPANCTRPLNAPPPRWT